MMNKNEFIKLLSSKANLSLEKAKLVNDVLESNWFISKKNKDKIIKEIAEKLNVLEKDAIRIYDESVKIINYEIKNKLKHPFKSNI